MNNQAAEMIEQFSKMSSKLAKGYETLRKIEHVDVATTPKELVWQSDKIKMYHYKRDTAPKSKIPVLISFAIINRHDVLDIQPDRSLVKKLLDEGLDIYIMDWGYPTKADKYLTMDDYINGYMNDAVDFVRKSTGNDKIHKLGICQGGTFSTIYSAIYPEKIKTLTVFVAPFEFSGNESVLFRWAKDIDVDTIVDSVGNMSADMLNQAFGMLKPTMSISKYTGIMDSLDDEDKLMNFLRMEAWKADTPDFPGECYRQYIKDLFQGNKLIKGELVVGDKKVDLKNITMPVMNIYATEDNIIPKSATVPLNDAIGSKDHEIYAFPGGHIGVFVGGKSQKELGPAVAKWINARSK